MSEIILCDYGCGQEAKFKMKNEKLCCYKRDDSRENLMMVHNGCNIKVNFKRETWKVKLKLINEGIIKNVQGVFYSSE